MQELQRVIIKQKEAINQTIYSKAKRTISRFTFSISLLAVIQASPLFAMEFGTMGNVSASMGGAGVALKSPFALYYNPALIASDSKMRIGYSIGLGLDQSNLDKLTNLDFSKMIQSLASLGSQLSGSNGVTTISTTPTTTPTTTTTTTPTTTPSTSAQANNNFTDALKNALQSSGATGNDLDAL